MMARNAGMVVAIAIAIAMLAVGSEAQGEWRDGRATFYGDQPWLWNIHEGSCGYGYIWEDEPLGWDVAALPDVHFEYSGSCGICYEVACNPTAFTDNYGNTIQRQDSCHDPTQSIVVRITDTCPCNYPSNEFSNKRWCCGDMDHLDLSIWAFEKLAPRDLGVIGLKYRPVPCDYQPNNPAPKPENPFPGVLPPPGAQKPAWIQSTEASEGTNAPVATVSETVQVFEGGGLDEKWRDESWNVEILDTQKGAFGGEAICREISPGGGIRLASDRGTFSGHVSLEIWVKSGGSIPNVDMELSGSRGQCNALPLENLSTSGSSNGFDRYSVYLKLFETYRPDEVVAFADQFQGCGGNGSDDVDSIIVKNNQWYSQDICIDNVKLI